MPSREAETRSMARDTVKPAGLLIGGHVFQLGQLLQLGHEAVGPAIQLIYVRIFQGVLILRPAHPVIDGDVLHWLHVQLDAVDLGQAVVSAGESRRRR